MSIAKEVGDSAGEGGAHNLGNVYLCLGDIQRAREYLSIAKESGDRAGEERAYGNLGNAYHWLGNFQQAIDCQKPGTGLWKGLPLVISAMLHASVTFNEQQSSTSNT